MQHSVGHADRLIAARQEFGEQLAIGEQVHQADVGDFAKEL